VKLASTGLREQRGNVIRLAVILAARPRSFPSISKDNA